MSYESEQQTQEGAGDGAEAGGGEDLHAALNGGGDMNFVTETKQPMNKGTLIVVGLLVACGAAVYFMYVRSGPSEAVAAGDPNADKTITSFLDGSQKNVEQMRKMLQDTEKVVQQFRTQANDTQVPLDKLATNPFMREKPKPREDTALLEREKLRQELTARANEASNDLRLQTIIHKDPKKASCMINQRLLRRGDKIILADGKVPFTIEEIRPDGVTVTTPVFDQALKFELKMKQ